MAGTLLSKMEVHISELAFSKCSRNAVFYFAITQNKIEGPSLLEICPFYYVWTLFLFSDKILHKVYTSD